MTTAKDEVFIWLYHENCYLVGGIKIWWEKSTWGIFQVGGEIRKLSASMGIPPIPQWGKLCNVFVFQKLLTCRNNTTVDWIQ